jgi:hypothetical protein
MVYGAKTWAFSREIIGFQDRKMQKIGAVFPLRRDAEKPNSRVLFGETSALSLGIIHIIEAGK